jgi:hypothetical protein
VYAIKLKKKDVKNKENIMYSTFVLLQYLLYLNPDIGLVGAYPTVHCQTFDSTSTIRPCNRVCHKELPSDFELEQIKLFFNNRPFSWAVDSRDTAFLVWAEKMD